MSWMDVLQALIALLFVIGLIIGLAYLARRFGWDKALSVGKSETPRLHVVEAKVLDPKRRLVLVRRDDQEHLLLLGGGNDLVIETGIEVSNQHDQKDGVGGAK